MRYRMLATYRGVPYEAGVGPSGADVVLFAACPPPEELGFEPATGHWRKKVIRAEIDALWESRPVGTFGGEPCIVLDDLGDRLHIAYLGNNPRNATRLGYWQIDRGVFELLTPREDVTGLTEERVDRPLRMLPPPAEPGDAAGTGSAGFAGGPDLPVPDVPLSPAAPDLPAASSAYAEPPLPDPLTGPDVPGSQDRAEDLATPLAPGWPSREPAQRGPAEPGLAGPGPGDTGPADAGPAESGPVRPGRAEPLPVRPGGTPGPAPSASTPPERGLSEPAPRPLAEPPQTEPPQTEPPQTEPAPAMPSSREPSRPETSLSETSLPETSLPERSLLDPSLPERSMPAPSSHEPSRPAPRLPERSSADPALPEPAPPGSAPPEPALAKPALAEPGPPEPMAGPTLPEPSPLAAAPPSPTASDPGASPAGPAQAADLPQPPASQQVPGQRASASQEMPRLDVTHPGPARHESARAGRRPKIAENGSRASRRQRVATRDVFCDLADLAGIPRAAYALEAEVDGVLCLVPTASGYEVFVSADGARHEVRSFPDEEAAYFYLFGVLVAEAIRNGVLTPAVTQDSSV
jgi:hypothetical protein